MGPNREGVRRGITCIFFQVGEAYAKIDDSVRYYMLVGLSRGREITRDRVARSEAVRRWTAAQA